jgi:hypothetical protein
MLDEVVVRLDGDIVPLFDGEGVYTMRHLVNGLPYPPVFHLCRGCRTAVDGLRITIDFAVDLDHQIDSAVVNVSTAEQRS